MLKKEFNLQYKNTYKKYLQMSITDRRICYGNMMVRYLEAKLITPRQYKNWKYPAFLNDGL